MKRGRKDVKKLLLGKNAPQFKMHPYVHNIDNYSVLTHILRYQMKTNRQKSQKYTKMLSHFTNIKVKKLLAVCHLMQFWSWQADTKSNFTEPRIESYLPLRLSCINNDKKLIQFSIITHGVV